MKFKIIFSFLLITNFIIAQEMQYQSIKKGDFPDGVYKTLDDVLKKQPTSTDEIYFETNAKYDDNNLPEKAFFYCKKTRKKLIFH